MKIITWNVNSVRTRLDRVLALLERHDPDLLCLQEIKSNDDAFPFDTFAEAGWFGAIHGQKSYNGVAFLSKEDPEEVERGFPGDPAPEQSRVISCEYAGLRVINAYVVNGKAVGDPKYDLKLAWLDALSAWLRSSFEPSQPLLLTGDFNVALDDRDVHDPDKWRGKVLCSEPERDQLVALLAWGLTDLHRIHYDGNDVHTWWDYRMGAFARGWGLRIDLFLGTRPLAERCSAVEVDREERKETSGEGKPSDHAPVILTLAD